MDIELPPDAVHIWAASAEGDEEELESCRRLLSCDEQERAARCGSQQRGHRYVLVRCILRLLLSGYLQVPARAVPLSYGLSGKPQLAQIDNDLQFNVSESGGFALLAFLRGNAVGVDIERERSIEQVADLAAQFFHPGECQDLAALRSDQLLAGFFACWTRKESYVKALGQGLSTPLDSFRVTVVPDEPARLLVASPGEAAENWNLQSIRPAPGFHGAVAYPGPARSVLNRTVALRSLVPKP